MNKPEKIILLVFIVFFFGFTGSEKLEKGTGIPVKPFENSRFEVIDSLRIHYRVWNEDLPNSSGKVLLIHGFCGSTFCWRNNYDTLVKAHYKVYAVDLPGFGYSERSVKLNQSQSNRARMIWELLAIIDRDDTTRWNIVGHSMGGGTAEAVALTRPERTKTLTIVDGMIFIKNDNVEKTVVGLVNHPIYKKMLLSYTEKNYLSYNNFRRELKGTYGFIPDSATVNGYLTPLLVDGTAETVVNLLANSDEIRQLNAKGLMSLPVLVIWGKKDHTIRLKQGKKLKRVVPSVELKVIPDARHMPMETHVAIFNSMLVEFLNRKR
ncbi:MAG: alpha/beta hydrolase [Bacteroidales bacterium]|jgi:pimeloyl-ACP methyl ester carboxylesterase|nr:alpha/beta hydrolase [Bacteroidales bacterium]